MSEHEQHDPRPDVAKDEKSPRKDIKEQWKQPEATLDEPPAGGPSAEEQSRQSDN